MKIYKPFYFLIICLSLWTLAGCNLPLEKTQTSEMVLTSAVETVNAQLTELPDNKTKTVTPTSQTQSAATKTPSPTSAPATQKPIPCNWAMLVSENLPDNTQIYTASSFEKKWLLKNIGSCTWTSGYRLVFDHGDRMEASSSTPFSNFSTSAIKPGEIIEIKIPLKAPGVAGVYQGDFLLQSSDGIVFGVGGSADGSFWVKVSVIEPTSTATATSTNTVTPTIIMSPTATNTMIPMPDLEITNFTLDKDSYTVAESVIASISITNLGNVNADAFTVKWIPDLTHSDQAQYKAVNALPSQEAVVLIFTLAGGYTEVNSSISTKVLADVDNMVIESDETNNDKTNTTRCTQ